MNTVLTGVVGHIRAAMKVAVDAVAAIRSDHGQILRLGMFLDDVANVAVFEARSHYKRNVGEGEEEEIKIATDVMNKTDI